MNRYRSYGPSDDPSIQDGDDGFVGCDTYTTPENLPPGVAQDALNIDFSTGDAATRGGFVCIPSLGAAAFNVSTGWTERTSTADKSWPGIAYGNGRFVAVSADAGANDVMYSTDGGATWTAASTSLSKSWRAITFGNNLFVVVGNASGGVSNTVAYSADGVNWTGANSASALVWTAITYGGGLFVATSFDGGTQGVMTSPTGSTWTIRNTPASQSGYDWKDIAYSDTLGLFVAVSDDGTTDRTMYSSDGITWTAGTTANLEARGIAWGSGVFVIVAASGGSSAAMTSSDGLTWTQRTTIAPSGFASWEDVEYGNGIFVAVSSSEASVEKQIMTSPNGVTWTAATSPAAQDWLSIAYGNGVFSVVPESGDGATLMTRSFYTTPNTTGDVLASGVYSDPNEIGSNYIMLVGTDRVGFYAFGKTAKTVPYSSGITVTEQSTIVQANNKVYIFRGSSDTPLVWEGAWAAPFQLATGSIVSTNQAVFVQNRLWCKNGKDTISASDVLDFTVFNALDNSVNIGKGDSNFNVTTFPFGDTTLIVFKNRSIVALTNLDGSLSDIVATEVTRQVGAVGINSVTTVGSDLVYVSDRNINLLSLTSTNNAVQHKILPLSAPIKKYFERVNWEYGYKISLAYHDNKLYVALPLDNATVCNSVVVYNFLTERWFGLWQFDADLGMAIQGWQVANYLGLQRLHAITEDGRIFVTDEGPQDISGTNVYEVESSITTRAYRADNSNRVNRRMWADLSTWRPQFSITAYVDGASESSEIVTDQTFARSESWLFNDSTYSLTNSGDNYNREGRKDYAGYCSDSIQPQSGFLPEMKQDYRFPIIFRRKGRLVWYKISNTQGTISVNGIGGEARSGDRSDYVQVI